MLELDAGQGRDTIGLLNAGLSVTAPDFAAEALKQLEHAAGPKLQKQLSKLVDDVRTPLPLGSLSQVAVYA